MASWLEMPELEAMVKAADAKPLGLGVLRECVAAIAVAVEREVQIEGDAPVMTFCNHRGAYYNVHLHDGSYRIAYLHQAAQLEFTAERTEVLAWRICGYRCTPVEMRAARERAARDGFTGKILPNEYFEDRKDRDGAA
jgi:hypothetical protein